jgi:O-antigen/teichoic acid export membrane protein
MSSGLKNLLIAATPRAFKPGWQRLEASTVAYRLARGAFWSLAGTAISRALGLCASIIVARILGKSIFGELGMIQSTVGMFGAFAGFGLGVTATKHVAELRVKDPARAGRIIGLSNLFSWISGGVLTVLLILMGPWLAEHTLAARHLGPRLRIASWLLLLGAVNGTQTGTLSGFEAFKQIAKINFWSGLAAFPLTLAGVWWGGLDGALWALVASQVLSCSLNFLELRRQAVVHRVILGFAGWREEVGVLWRFSLPALFAGAMAIPINWACGALLVNQQGGYAEMGVFNAANQWFNALLFLPSMVGQAVLPVVADLLSNDDTRRSGRVLAILIKVNGLAMLVPILAGCLLSPLIMASYGPGFRNAWPTMMIVLVTAGVLGIQTPVGQIIIAAGRMWLGALMNLGWGVVFIIGTLLLIHRGAFGLATARLIAYLLHALWTLGFGLATIRRTRNQAFCTPPASC